jgi:regulatory protein YycH of two-component signal transduction system YycFG
MLPIMKHSNIVIESSIEGSETKDIMKNIEIIHDRIASIIPVKIYCVGSILLTRYEDTIPLIIYITKYKIFTRYDSGKLM